MPHCPYCDASLTPAQCTTACPDCGQRFNPYAYRAPVLYPSVGRSVDDGPKPTSLDNLKGWVAVPLFLMAAGLLFLCPWWGLLTAVPGSVFLLVAWGIVRSGDARRSEHWLMVGGALLSLVVLGLVMLGGARMPSH